MSTCLYCSSPVAQGAASCPSCEVLLPGSMVGHYRLGKVLGKGGFGVTYAGYDTSLQRPVALKELFPDGSGRVGTTVAPSSSAGRDWERTKDQFLEEGQALARLSGNRGVVAIYEVVPTNNTVYLVMEKLTGPSLGATLTSLGRLPEQEVGQLARSLCESLAAVHALGLLHRDIKPDNILLEGARGPVLVDFGAARAYSAAMTKAMTRMLTPGYAPLEQYAEKGRFGPPTDLYALGATLYHALVGSPPPSAADRAAAAQAGDPDPLPPLPGSSPLCSAVMACLAMSSRDRPQSADELVELLDSRPETDLLRGPRFQVGSLQAPVEEPVLSRDTEATSTNAPSGSPLPAPSAQQAPPSQNAQPAPVAQIPPSLAASASSDVAWVAVPKHRGELLSDRSIALTGTTLLVGRFDPSTGPVDIDLGSLPDGNTVSRNHAKLEAVEGGWKVSDVNPGAGNGIFVRAAGEERFSSRLDEPRVLSDGDEVGFGQVILVIKKTP